MKVRRVARSLFSLAGTIMMLVAVCAAGKLPGTLKVTKDDGTVENWTVSWVKKPMCIAGDTGTKWAVTNCKKRTMTFWTGMSREQTADLFVHEMMHVVTGCEDKDEDLHDAIYELAPGVRRILRDNPEWAAFVMHAPVSNPPLQYGVGPVDMSCALPARSTEAAAGGK